MERSRTPCTLAFLTRLTLVHGFCSETGLAEYISHCIVRYFVRQLLTSLLETNFFLVMISSSRADGPLASWLLKFYRRIGSVYNIDFLDDKISKENGRQLKLCSEHPWTLEPESGTIRGGLRHKGRRQRQPLNWGFIYPRT